MIKQIFKSSKGMTLFIAISIMSILLFISFAVVNITIKASLFSSSGRDSQFAFSAADAGLECALHWDSKFEPSKFATSTPGVIVCAGQSISTGSQSVPTNPAQSSLIGGGGNGSPTSIFYFNLNQGSNPLPFCAIVSVTKNSNGTTYIKSRGYNTCDIGNPRRVERGIEVIY